MQHLAHAQRLLHVSAPEIWERVRRVVLAAARDWTHYGVRPAAAWLPLLPEWTNGQIEPVGPVTITLDVRPGEFVTLRDVVDEVGPDVVRFMMLFRKNEAPLDFDFAKVRGRDGAPLLHTKAYYTVNEIPAK